ncbi:MAG: PQQ-binding-like beta-propeller repeat protein [Planctomycetota bacterium]|nr:PQQ-binding-like beta-propeller repeat protein [Planctomycetota bacterium]
MPCERLRPGVIASRAIVSSLVLFCAFGFCRCVLAQADPPPGAEAVFFEIDSTASRKLGAARELILNRKWREATDLIDQATASPSAGLVSIDPGRLLGVRAAADLLLSAIPGDGIQSHLARVDPLARRWYDEALAEGNDEILERIVERAFQSQYSAKALLILGDRALERGDSNLARGYWERLLPPFDTESPPEGIPPVAYHPRPEIELALLRARMVLASLAAGDRERATREAMQFRNRHPNDTGDLAGVSGQLAEVLEAEISAAAGEETFEPSDRDTLGGSPSRTRVVSEAVDVGAIRWLTPLAKVQVDFRESKSQNPFEARFLNQGLINDRVSSSHVVLATFPLIHDQGVFFCDETSIRALALTSRGDARPLWGDSPVIHSLDPRGPIRPGGQRVGLPAFTLSIADNRLYARLGRGGPSRGAAALVEALPSTLVCLDLAREGDLLWSVSADRFADEVGNWVFDGAPLPYEDHLYVLLRKSTPQPTLHIACLEPATGTVIWNRRLCQGLDLFSGDYDEQQHLLLSAADGRVYCATNLGAVAAVDARSGDLLWGATYNRVEFDKVPEFHNRQTLGPNPCVIEDGIVFVAPTDSNSIIAFDASSGIRLWDRPLPGTARQIIGVSHNRVIVAGDQLWGLVPETGAVAWSRGRDGPEAKTHGRGTLAGDFVYWPRFDEILVVEAATGRVRREISLTGQHQIPGGGNLVIAEGFLVCAQTDRLVAFWEYANRKKRLEQDMAAQPNQSLPALRLALHEEAEGATSTAVDLYRRLLGSTKDVTWYGQSAHARAREHLANLAKIQADAASDQREPLVAAEFYRLTAQNTPMKEIRASALIEEAHAHFKTGEVTDAVAVLNTIREDPDLVRLPPGAGQTKTVSMVCDVELSRAREILRNAYDLNSASQATEKLRHAMARGSVSNLPIWLTDVRLTPELSIVVKSGAEIAENQRDSATATALCETLKTHASDPAIREWASNRLQSALATPDETAPPDSTRSAETETVFWRTRRPSNDSGTAGRSIPQGSCHWRVDGVGGNRVFLPDSRPPAGQPDWLLTAGEQSICRSFSSGEVRWTIPMAEPVEWAGGTTHITILATRSRVCGRDATTGTLRWARSAPPREKSGGPPQFRVAGNVLLLFAPPVELTAVDLSTGRSLWRYAPRRDGMSLARAEVALVNGQAKWRYRPSAGWISPYWLVRDQIVAVQTTHPRRTLFFDIDDGFARDVPTPPGHDWIDDPLIGSTDAVWGVARCADSFHDFDGRTGQLNLRTPNLIHDGVRAAYLPGDLPLDNGTAFLSQRDGFCVSLRSAANGGTLWQLRLPVTANSPSPVLHVDEERLVVALGPIVRCHSLSDGHLVWEYLWESAAPQLKLRLQIAGESLLVWNDRNESRLDVDCLDRRTGHCCERWHVPGSPAATPVTVANSSVILLTDCMTAEYRPRFTRNAK